MTSICTSRRRLPWRFFPLTVAFVLYATHVFAQGNPCTDIAAGTTTVMTSVTAPLYAELLDHNTPMPNAPAGTFVTQDYIYREFNAMAGNPDTGPFLLEQVLPRNAWAPVAGTTPTCYQTSITSTPLQTQPFVAMRSVIVARGADGITASAPASSNPFVLALLRIGAVRRGR